MRHVFITIALLFIALPSFAKDIKHTAGGVQFSVPDSWNIEQAGPAYQATTPDDAAYILFLGLKGSEIEQRFNEVDTLLAEAGVTGFSPENPQETQINGMVAMLVGGKAKLEGKSVEVGLVFLVPPAGENAIIILGLTQNTANDKAIEQVIMSMKPL